MPHSLGFRRGYRRDRPGRVRRQGAGSARESPVDGSAMPDTPPGGRNVPARASYVRFRQSIASAWYETAHAKARPSGDETLAPFIQCMKAIWRDAAARPILRHLPPVIAELLRRSHMSQSGSVVDGGGLGTMPESFAVGIFEPSTSIEKPGPLTVARLGPLRSFP